MPATASAHILIVDDEPDIRGLLRDVLEDEGYRVSDAPDAEAARLLVAQQAPDAVLLDIWMPGEDGLSLLRGWAEAGRRRGGLAFPVVMMSGHGTVDTAVEATKLGAYDFIEKPITLAKLLITLQRALEASRLRADNAALRRQAQPVKPLGDSASMAALRDNLQRLAGHDNAVLLRGEPGTGKETLARWMHSIGPRREQPFIAVVPGAIASGQAATTLFGAEDASGVRPGLLEQAQGGTLFLDEVAELDAELQQRLSSVIERGQLLRVGGQQPVELDVRVVAATAQDLEAARAQGRFRDELYFQLSVVPLEVPPLRERRADLTQLLEQYARHFASRDGLSPRRFGPAAKSRLQRHDWPGNQRELRNLVQRLTLLGSDEVSVAEIDAMLDGRVVPAAAADAGASGIDFSLPLREAREQFERLYLSRRLDEAGGSVGKLAKMSGMERTHLYRKLRDLGVDNRSGGRDD